MKKVSQGRKIKETKKEKKKGGWNIQRHKRNVEEDIEESEEGITRKKNKSK